MSYMSNKDIDIQELREELKEYSNEDLCSYDGFWLHEDRLKEYFVIYAYNNCNMNLILNESNYDFIKEEIKKRFKVDIDNSQVGDPFLEYIFTGAGASYHLAVHRDNLEGLLFLREIRHRYDNCAALNDDDYYERRREFGRERWNDCDLQEKIELVNKYKSDIYGETFWAEFNKGTDLDELLKDIPMNDGSLNEWLETE